ncbi:MAG: hypothetical protein V1899_07540 [Planctomycetota bacterium]
MMSKKKSDTLAESKETICLKCRRKFMSPNKLRIRICSTCKNRRSFR